MVISGYMECGRKKETGKPARRFVLGVVQTVEGLPLTHSVHSGNVSETGTLQAMVQTVLKRFPVQRVIMVADRDCAIGAVRH